MICILRFIFQRVMGNVTVLHYFLANFSTEKLHNINLTAMIALIVINQCWQVNTFFFPKRKLTIPANSPQTPTMNRMLKTADPTMVPTPTSLSAMKTPVKQQQRKFKQRQRIFRLWHRKFRRLKGTCLTPLVRPIGRL